MTTDATNSGQQGKRDTEGRPVLTDEDEEKGAKRKPGKSL
jgi:hypothetical protein